MVAVPPQVPTPGAAQLHYDATEDATASRPHWAVHDQTDMQRVEPCDFEGQRQVGEPLPPAADGIGVFLLVPQVEHHHVVPTERRVTRRSIPVRPGHRVQSPIAIPPPTGRTEPVM